MPHGHQWIDEEDIAALSEVLHSDWITQGPKVAEFEEKFAKYIGAKYAVAVNSGTVALHAACFAAKIEFEDLHLNYNISFIDENIPLGTAGGLKYLEKRIDTPFFVSNCDIIINCDYFEIYKFHKKDKFDLTLVSSIQHHIYPMFLRNRVNTDFLFLFF